MTKKDFDSILKFDIDYEPWSLFYLEILDIVYFDEFNLFHTKEIKRNNLIKMLRALRTTLKEHTIPMKKEDLHNKSKFIKLNEYELDILAKSIGATSKTVQNKTYYKPLVGEDWSAGRLAYLILWETGSQMTTQEIVDEMYDRFGLTKKLFNTVNQMGYIDAIQNIDRHTWALKEWEMESMYVIHIMKDVLKKSNRPMKVKEVVEKVKERKSNVRSKSIEAYSHLDAFKRLNNGKIVLSK